jgi:xanthine dehydrogenase/oxidase
LIQDAIAAKSYLPPQRTLINGDLAAGDLAAGDLAAGLQQADHIIEGSFRMGGQEHFYLETQACIAVPKGEDGEMEIFCSSQNPTALQVWEIR